MIWRKIFLAALLGFIIFVLMLLLSTLSPEFQGILFDFLGVRHLEDMGTFLVGSFFLAEAISFGLVGAVAVIRRLRK